MCLSSVYFKNRDDKNLAAEEIVSIINNNGSIVTRSILGDEKKFDGYLIDEVNLSENFIIISKR